MHHELMTHPLFGFTMNPRKSSANCGIFSYRGAYSLQNLLDKKKEVFVNKEYVRPFDHRTAPQQYGGNKGQGYQTGDSCQEISVE